MIESSSIASVIEQQIQESINRAVEQQLEKTIHQLSMDPVWVAKIEKTVEAIFNKKINRDIASFDIKETVSENIEVIAKHWQENFDQNFEKSSIIEQKIKTTVDHTVEKYIEKTIDNLTVDSSWIAKLENLVNQTFVRKINDHIALIDVNTIIAENIDSITERWQEKFKKEFETAGIVDLATKKEVKISDDLVEIQTNLTSSNLLVNNDAEVAGNLIVNNLIVKGVVNTDNFSWNELAVRVAQQAADQMTDQWQQTLVDQVLNLAKTQGIDFETITINQQPIINGNKLNFDITETNIETVGILKELKVAGSASLSNTLITKNKRVGINTREPEMALSIWDEEVSVIAGKIAEKQAFIGTARLQNLSIGVNRTPAIDIDSDGLTTIKNLRLDKFKLGHASETPGFSGSRGDFLINSDPKPGLPFAWLCLGNFKWQPLYSAK